MLRKLVMAIILLSIFTVSAEAQSPPKIEIFNINKGKVIKELPMQEDVQLEVENIISGITDIYRGFEPIPKKGHMVRIPLDPAVEVNNEWFHDLVSEVIVIFPEYENPLLMVFNEENNMPYFWTFEGSVDALLKKLNLKLKGMTK